MFISRTVLWTAFTLFAPGLLSGCSTVGEVKNALHEASNTLIKIANLGTDRSHSAAKDELYTVEDKILVACRDLLASANYRLNSEEIPLGTRLAAALTAQQCQRTVREAQHELEAFDSQSLLPDP